MSSSIKKINYYLKNSSRLLFSLFILALLISPLLSASPANAQIEPRVKINSPANGATVTSQALRVTVAYSGIDASKSLTWQLGMEILQDGSSLYGDTAYLNESDGSINFDVDISTTPAGLYTIKVTLWTLSHFGVRATDQITVNLKPGSSSSTIPQKTSGGANPWPYIIGIGIAGGGAGVLIQLVKNRNKMNNKKPSPAPATQKDLYQDWWNSASPVERQNWVNFEKYLTALFGLPAMSKYVDASGKASWVAAYNAWQKLAAEGKTALPFEEWARQEGIAQVRNKLSNAKFCVKCGSPLAGGESFCRKCGTKLP